MSAVDVVLTAGDTRYGLRATLTRPGGIVEDLTGAAVQFRMRSRRTGAVVVDGEAVIVDAAAGRVRYDWKAADTATVGFFEAQFQVQFADGTVQTYPNELTIGIEIMQGV